MNHTVVLEPRNHKVTSSPVKWEYGCTCEFLQGQLKCEVGVSIRELTGVKEHTFYLWYSASWSFRWDITVVLESQNNCGSIDHSTPILHEPSTVNGLHRNYCCTYIGHKVTYSDKYILVWRAQKASSISTSLCVLILESSCRSQRGLSHLIFLKPTVWMAASQLVPWLHDSPWKETGILESILSDQKCI